MKRIYLALLLVATCSNLLAQKTIRDENAEKRTVPGFHGISVATGIRLYLTEGSVEEVAVSASKTEFRDRIVTRVENGILKIEYEKKTGAINRRGEDKELRAYVSYRTLDRLEATTGAVIDINGTLAGDNLELYCNTGARMNGTIDIRKFSIHQTTGSIVTLSGKTEVLVVEGTTGSKFYGEGLNASQCSANVTTGAQVNVSVEKEMTAKANTGGRIRYKGSANLRDVKYNTGGRISRI